MTPAYIRPDPLSLNSMTCHGPSGGRWKVPGTEETHLRPLRTGRLCPDEPMTFSRHTGLRGDVLENTNEVVDLGEHRGRDRLVGEGDRELIRDAGDSRRPKPAPELFAPVLHQFSGRVRPRVPATSVIRPRAASGFRLYGFMNGVCKALEEPLHLRVARQSIARGRRAGLVRHEDSHALTGHGLEGIFIGSVVAQVERARRPDGRAPAPGGSTPPPCPCSNRTGA